MSNLTEGNGVLVAGHACYELGEVHRLLGQDDAAELAHRRATSLGASVQPGLALLRLRQGNTSAAARGLNRAIAEATRAPARGRLLPAVVTIALAADDVAEAQQALTELEMLTQILSSSVRGLARGGRVWLVMPAATSRRHDRRLHVTDDKRAVPVRI